MNELSVSHVEIDRSLKFSNQKLQLGKRVREERREELAAQTPFWQMQFVGTSFGSNFPQIALVGKMNWICLSPSGVVIA